MFEMSVTLRMNSLGPQVWGHLGQSREMIWSLRGKARGGEPRVAPGSPGRASLEQCNMPWQGESSSLPANVTA